MLQNFKWKHESAKMRPKIKLEAYFVRVKLVQQQERVQVGQGLASNRSLQLDTHSIGGRKRFHELRDLTELVSGQVGTLNFGDGRQDSRSHDASQNEDEDELSYCESWRRGSGGLECG